MQPTIQTYPAKVKIGHLPHLRTLRISSVGDVVEALEKTISVVTTDRVPIPTT